VIKHVQSKQVNEKPINVNFGVNAPATGIAVAPA
jgi:hypothetical protein